jgi:hypothetical protein
MLKLFLNFSTKQFQIMNIKQKKKLKSLLTIVTLWSVQDRNIKSYPPRLRHR